MGQKSRSVGELAEVKGLNHSKPLKVIRNFILASLFVGIYYFFTYCKEFVLGEFQASAIMGTLDGAQFYVLGLMWVKLIDAVIRSENPKLNKWRKAMNPAFILFMTLSMFPCVFLLDHTPDGLKLDIGDICYRLNGGAKSEISTDGQIILVREGTGTYLYRQDTFPR